MCSSIYCLNICVKLDLLCCLNICVKLDSLCDVYISVCSSSHSAIFTYLCVAWFTLFVCSSIHSDVDLFVYSSSRPPYTSSQQYDEEYRAGRDYRPDPERYSSASYQSFEPDDTRSARASSYDSSSARQRVDAYSPSPQHQQQRPSSSRKKREQRRRYVFIHDNLLLVGFCNWYR